MALETAPVVTGALVGGYLGAPETRHRPLGGLVLAAGGLAAGRSWWRTVGSAGTALLTSIYLGGFRAWHPLAKRTRPWPGVLSAAATSALASCLVADRRS